MDSTRSSIVRVVGRWSLALIAIVLLGGTAGAGESPGRSRAWSGPDRPDAESARSNGPARKVVVESRLAPFARERILPRVSMQLEAFSAFRHAEPDRDIGDLLLHDEMTREVRRGVERATRRAVKDFLIHVTEVDRLVERLRRRGKALVDPAGGPGGPGRARNVRFDVGFHRLMPEVQMRYGVGHGDLRFSVDAEGSVSVQYRDVRMTRGSVVVGFDGDDTYRLNWNVGF